MVGLVSTVLDFNEGGCNAAFGQVSVYIINSTLSWPLNLEGVTMVHLRFL